MVWLPRISALPGSRLGRLPAGLLALAAFTDASAQASNVIFKGTVQYQISGSSVTLTVNEILNQGTNTTGTLRIELWAFPSAYSGAAETGYLLADYQLTGSTNGTLTPNSYFNAFSETVPYNPPPNGLWYYSLLLTEYTNASVDDGFTEDDYANFPNPVQIGPAVTPTPTPTPAPTPTPTPTPAPVTSSARLSNLSIRSTAGGSAAPLIAGFVVGGSGSKRVLARADGPALSGFGVTGSLPDPVLTLYNSTPAQVAQNSGWGGSAALSSVFSQVGAFALSPTSKDAALLSTLGQGAYTANVSSVSNDSGVALVEVYDADTGTPSSRFINLSARSEAGTGAQTLIAGFVIAGTGDESVLIRGDGPSLTQFGVTGVLASPQLTLFDSNSKVIASDSGWGNAPTRGPSTVSASLSSATAAIFTEVGAFQFPAGSADSALVVSLPPGAYTAQVTGANSTTGQALVEVYELPSSGGGGSGGQAPVITAQPVSQTVSTGVSFTLTVTASGASSYQWYLDGTAIPGATSSTYAGTAAGTYTVVVSNAYGSTTSTAAKITAGTSGGGLTGTWRVTWTENNAGGGFCAYETWAVTWVLTQTGSQVSGTYSQVITGEDTTGLCPDSQGATESGTLSGSVSGSTFTLTTDYGTIFTGTIGANGLSGLGSNAGPSAVQGDISTGPFAPTAP